MTETPATDKRKGLRLNPGVTRGNLRTFFFAGFMAASLMVYVTISNNYLITTFLNVPQNQLGRVAGNLLAVREIVVLISIAISGLLADKFGRRVLFSVGFLCLALSYLLFPYAASEIQLIVYYAINGVGAAFITCMLTTILADYVLNEDRGKAGGIQGILLAISGLTFMQSMVALPKLLQSRVGMESLAAGRVAYAIIAVLCALTAIVCWLGLQKHKSTQSAEQKGYLQLLREGLSASKDPAIALAYAAAFVSRGDLIVVGAFLTNWIGKAARAQGMDTATSFARALPILFISAGIQIIVAPLIGRVTDRMSRVMALAIAAAIGTIAYCSAILVEDPLGNGLKLVAVLLGAAQISGIITSQVLIAQYAPPAIRGSVVGFFGFCGALAQIILAKVGGLLFDRWTEAGPFVLVGLLNAALVVLALLVRNRVRPLVAQEAGQAAPALH